jgi:hypothetical protein
MRRLHRLASILTWLLRRDRAEQRLDDELQAFIEMSAADRMREGVSPAEARRLARLELGGVEQAKERVRTERHGAGLDEILRDVRYAFRMCTAQWSVTAVIVATLALAIGANTAIFSIVNSLLLRELPVKEPGRLALLTTPGQQTWTYPIWDEVQRHAGSFDGALAWSTFDSQFNLTQGGETQFVRGLYVSGDAFSTLGVSAMLGRTLIAADDVPGGGEHGPVAVISHAFWRGHFGGAPDAIGRSLTIEGTPFTIVGVTPPTFFGLSVGRSFDVAVPFGVEPLIRGVSGSPILRREQINGPDGFGYTSSLIPEDEPLAVFNAITPDWLRSYRTALVAGRDVTVRDTQSSAQVALVNQAHRASRLDPTAVLRNS